MDKIGTHFQDNVNDIDNVLLIVKPHVDHRRHCCAALRGNTHIQSHLKRGITPLKIFKAF